MDDFLSIGLGIAILSYTIIGVLDVHFLDDRSFKEIKKQCESQHYIQDKTTRIKCEVDK